MEQLKSIPECNGYMISDYGNLYKLPNMKVMRQIDSGGYKRVTLTVDGLKKSLLIHRLVAMAFIGVIPNEHQVNHIDGNKTNNHLLNLEIVTPLENMQHASASGLMPRGVNHVHRKLNDDIVRQIRYLSHTRSCQEIANELNIHQTTVYYIATNRAWKHVPLEAPLPNMKNCGARNAASKLTENDVRDIRRLKNSKTCKQLADIYNVSPATISNACTGLTFSHVK